MSTQMKSARDAAVLGRGWRSAAAAGAEDAHEASRGSRRE